MSFKLNRLRSLGDIMSSADMRAIVESIADGVAANVSDPNPAVRETLRTQVFEQREGRTPARVVGQVGMAPWLRGVEAKRGPIAKAIGGFRA